MCFINSLWNINVMISVENVSFLTDNAQNTDFWCRLALTSIHNLFWSKNKKKKKMITLVNPSFTYYKCGLWFKGYIFHGAHI